MGILPRYLNREFFKLLFICLLAFVFIYLVIHFSGRIDDFIEANVPTGRMLLYFAYAVPHILVQMLPPATLIAVIVLFSTMKKNNEIIALKTCGMNVLRLSLPLLGSSIALAGGLFLFSELVVPYASSQSQEIWRVEVRKRDPGRFYGQERIWYKGDDRIYGIRNFDSRKLVMMNPTFYFFKPSFHLYKRIDARAAVWKDDRWVAMDGITQEAGEKGIFHLSRFDELPMEIPETPETFIKEEKKPEEMGYWQLERFARGVQREGYDAAKYFVDLHIKLSFPFILPIMILIGTPIALKQKRGGTPLAVALGMVFCFFYLLVLGFSRSVGIGGLLPPLLSAWLANGIFFFAGIYLIMNVDR
jgi:lipopolysaccharide export system permease protein